MNARSRTIFIVEDDEPTRHSLARKIASPDLHVAVAVGTCREILQSLESARPDVLLVDLGLPDGNGVDVVRQVARRWPQVLIMVITVFGDESRVVGAIKAGATGYLLKDDAAEGIGEAIRQLLSGGAPISPGIARHLIRQLRPAAGTPASASVIKLSSREHEVLTLASKGYSYSETAALLGLTASTVGSYTKTIYEKLAVGSRSEAVFEATRLGLIDDSPD
ncbi:MAG TPA: response regulator transcription factor [Steroidobacteraceae bacterium]|nr:response regulator transcription factor [Steroidobacteraceae bacterium]